MPNDKKIKLVEEYKDLFNSNNFFISINPTGSAVSSISKFRKEIIKADAQYKVVKNSLALIAADQSTNNKLNELIDGPTSILASNADPMNLTKLIYKFINDEQLNIKIKNAYLDGEIIEEELLNNISKLPSKEELISKLLMLISSPLNRLVYNLKFPISQFTNTLKAIVPKLTEAEEPKAATEEVVAEEPKAATEEVVAEEPKAATEEVVAEEPKAATEEVAAEEQKTDEKK